MVEFRTIKDGHSLRRRVARPFTFILCVTLYIWGCPPWSPSFGDRVGTIFTRGVIPMRSRRLPVHSDSISTSPSIQYGSDESFRPKKREVGTRLGPRLLHAQPSGFSTSPSCAVFSVHTEGRLEKTISRRFGFRLEIGTYRSPGVRSRDAQYHSPFLRQRLSLWIGMSIVWAPQIQCRQPPQSPLSSG